MAEFKNVIGETAVDASEIFEDAVVRVTFTVGWRFKVGLFFLMIACRILRSKVIIEREQGR